MKNINEFIKESKNNVKHDDLGGRGMFYTSNGELTYFEDCYAYPVDTDDCIEITLLRTDVSKQGIGIDLLEALIEYAKSVNKKIVVYASPIGDKISEKDLIDFYMKNGFVQDERTDDKHCLIYNV